MRYTIFAETFLLAIGALGCGRLDTPDSQVGKHEEVKAGVSSVFEKGHALVCPREATTKRWMKSGEDRFSAMLRDSASNAVVVTETNLVEDPTWFEVSADPAVQLVGAQFVSTGKANYAQPKRLQFLDFSLGLDEVEIENAFWESAVFSCHVATAEEQALVGIQYRAAQLATELNALPCADCRAPTFRVFGVRGQGSQSTVTPIGDVPLETLVDVIGKQVRANLFPEAGVSVRNAADDKVAAFAEALRALQFETGVVIGVAVDAVAIAPKGFQEDYALFPRKGGHVKLTVGDATTYLHAFDVL